MQTQIIPSQITLPENAVVFHDSQPRTTSIKVADAFGKLHKNVIQKIESLDCSSEFASANFSAHEEMIQAGAVKRPSKVYEMTKDGFMFLVMGFTGKKAAAIKEAYINEFNRMAATLNQITGKTPPKPKPGQLTADQQTSIKELVKARVEALPQNRRAKAAITCWSALKSKFGCTYKLIAPEHFTEAVSLVARLPLEGELLAADPAPAPAPAGVVLNDYELQAVMLMRVHFQHVYRIFKEHDMYDALKALGSPVGVKMIDHFKDGLCQAGMMNRLEAEWQQARIRFGLPAVEAKFR